MNADKLIVHDEVGIDPLALKAFFLVRMVMTHDSHGIPLLMGNREYRRSHIKNRGTSKPKQFHKQGH